MQLFILWNTFTYVFSTPKKIISICLQMNSVSQIIIQSSIYFYARMFHLFTIPVKSRWKTNETRIGTCRGKKLWFNSGTPGMHERKDTSARAETLILSVPTRSRRKIADKVFIARSSGRFAHCQITRVLHLFENSATYLELSSRDLRGDLLIGIHKIYSCVKKKSFIIFHITCVKSSSRTIAPFNVCCGVFICASNSY